MSQTGYLVLAISILVALLAIFIVSFILYKRTPVPKGCENIKISEENCSSCLQLRHGGPPHPDPDRRRERHGRSRRRQ